MITCIEDQLKRDEGWRSYPYRDSVGKITIGYGRNLSDVGILASEGETMLQNDVSMVIMRLEEAFPWVTAMDEVRRGVLLNMAFNMGIGGLSGFKDFLGKMQAGEWSQAAGAMLDSKWAVQVGDRAKRLSIQIETGSWQ